MKVTIQQNVISFADIEIGEVFKCSLDSDNPYFYMKIISILNDENEVAYNAICLNDGDLAFFDYTDKVYPYPHSELIVK